MDGAHSHGGGGGGIPPEAIMVLLVIVGFAVVGPIILAIIQALITLLLICIGVACVGVITYLALRVRSAAVAGSLPWQQRGYGQLTQARERHQITASTERLDGHIILTAEEYETIRRQRYDN